MRAVTTATDCADLSISVALCLLGNIARSCRHRIAIRTPSSDAYSLRKASLSRTYCLLSHIAYESFLESRRLN